MLILKGGTRNGNNTKENGACSGFLTFWVFLVSQMGGKDGIPPRWHRNRRSNQDLYRQVRLVFEDV